MIPGSRVQWLIVISGSKVLGSRSERLTEPRCHDPQACAPGLSHTLSCDIARCILEGGGTTGHGVWRHVPTQQPVAHNAQP